MRILISVFAAILVLCPTLGLPSAADAGEARRRPPQRNVLRISGDDPRIVVMGEPVDEGAPSPSALIGVSCPPIMPVAQDGWTTTFECWNAFIRQCPAPIAIHETENYEFRLAQVGSLTMVDPFDVGLALKVKVPATGLPLGMSVDFVILPCAPRTSANLTGEDMAPAALPSPLLFVDDVVFPAMFFPTVADALPYERTVAVFFTDLCELIGPGVFDWWAMIEFSPASCADLDADGSPESGLTLARDNPAGRTVYCTSGLAESLGADAIDFFVFRVPHHVTRLNVFEPHGNFPAASPAASGLGRMPGEDGTTRPWCFSLVAPGICLSGDPMGNGITGGRVQNATQIFDDTSVPVMDSDTPMDVMANLCAALQAKGYVVMTDPINPLKKRLLRYPPALPIGHRCPRADDLRCINNVPGLNCTIGF